MPSIQTQNFMKIKMAIELLIIHFDFIGKILLAVMALMVHSKVTREKRIDRKVLGEMKLEKSLGILALILFTISYLMEVLI